MPELAEVDYFRRRWDIGLRQKVVDLTLHAQKRIFRGINPAALRRALEGSTFIGSQARGKQMLFRFGRDAWLGVHLGMTGELRYESRRFEAGRHDHLVLHQARQSLVFSDPRMFGRVLFHQGPDEPVWWTRLPPALTSDAFTLEYMCQFLERRSRAPLKGVLLQQECFIGIGNWMADEILWRAGIHPLRCAGQLSAVESRGVWRAVRFVSKGALRIMAKDWTDPPPSWLFQHRWTRGGRCPRDGRELGRATIGGRTTAWCPRCQPG